MKGGVHMNMYLRTAGDSSESIKSTELESLLSHIAPFQNSCHQACCLVDMYGNTVTLLHVNESHLHLFV